MRTGYASLVIVIVIVVVGCGQLQLSLNDAGQKKTKCCCSALRSLSCLKDEWGAQSLRSIL